MDNPNLIDYSDVASLLPHTGAMVLLDKVINYDGESLHAGLTVRNDGLFGNDANIPAWTGIEYMAQAIGAYAGIKAILAGEPIRLGYLLGTRRYNSNVSTFAAGTALTVRITNIMQDELLGVFDCRIMGEGIEVTANLNVYQPKTDDLIISKAQNATHG